MTATASSSSSPLAGTSPCCSDPAPARRKGRPRTRIERFVEPYLCAIIGAQYGFIFFVLGGVNVWLNMGIAALLFFVVDFCWLRFVETEAKEKGAY